MLKVIWFLTLTFGFLLMPFYSYSIIPQAGVSYPSSGKFSVSGLTELTTQKTGEIGGSSEASVTEKVKSAIPHKVVICGICRDVETPLLSTMRIIEEIGNLFEDYKVVVYENNSSDCTPQLLQHWALRNPRVLARSEHITDQMYTKFIINHTWDNSIFRVERIAYARNKVLDIVMTDEYEEFDYLIWLDMDFETPPSYEAIIETFHSNLEWDAVFAYGIDRGGNYYDWYEFRDQVYPIGAELLGDYYWHLPKSLILSMNDHWHPVISAFGGFGIYKKSSMIGCRYSAVVTDDLSQVAGKIIDEGIISSHPIILDYLDKIKLLPIVSLGLPKSGMPIIEDYDVGITLPYKRNLVWRMNSGVQHYPSAPEHVNLHASMIIKGHGKFYINPRIIFVWGG
ncbi:MAG: hypothetical protein H0U49_12885 [Parachlamydiaceae bacterium]|nr:hypothetical protein [Parachlamydiaceae bacterium]